MNSRVLTDEHIARVDRASMELLERVGVGLPHPEMRSRFKAAGATVDEKTERVRIPRELVKKCLASCGKSYTLYGRNPAKTAEFGAGKRNYNSIAGEASWVDEPGVQRRYTTLKDVETATRLGDALECLTIPGAMSDPHEMPVSFRCVEVAATMLRNTTKPITFWYHDRASAKFLNEILIALRGDEKSAAEKPAFYPFLEPISPLRFAFNGVDLLFETARLNLPVPIGPMAQMGMSAPGTVAGTIAQENAEILAGVCVTQLVRPGMPVCYGGICHAFDMRTTQMIFSGPEQAIFGVAMTQMGKHYGLPVYINVGLTDAKRPDAQAGFESGITLMLGAAAGADIFGHMGISGVDQASSLDVLVMQHEVIRYVESVMRSIDFSDDAFGFDVTAEVGPGGTFIDQPHTAEHFRRELWFPQLGDRDYYQAWLDAGAPDFEKRCRERKEHLLATHEVEPMPKSLDKALAAVVRAARKELAKGR